MEKIFGENGNEVTPEDVMNYNLQHGSITMSQYMQWLMTDRSWESVSNSIIGCIKDVVKDKKDK